MSDNVWCKHYNGLGHATCEAGVVYREVAAPSATSPSILRFPCFADSLAPTLCAKRAMPTADEIAEKERRAKEAVEAYMAKLDANICPFCGQPIERKAQVGRCVYAEPCNHRLYQGRLTEAERAANRRNAPSTEQTGLWDKR